MMWWIGCALVMAEVSQTPCEARVSDLEAAVVELKAAQQGQNARLEQRLDELQLMVGQQAAQLAEQAAALKEMRDAPAVPVSTKQVGVDAAGTGRVLSQADGVSIGAQSWQAHFFPDNHSCPNLDSSRPTMLLPVKKDSTVTFNPHPNDLPADAQVSLRSIAADWSSTEVQSFPAHFKLIHDASCSATPTLELSLRTTVGGVDLGAKLEILESLQAWSSQRGFVYGAAPAPPPLAPLMLSAATVVSTDQSSHYDTVSLTDTAAQAFDGNTGTLWHSGANQEGYSQCTRPQQFQRPYLRLSMAHD